jgi:hypothetical protein
MRQKSTLFTDDHVEALRNIIAQAGAGARTTPAINRIQARVQELKQVGIRPSKSALSRLDMEFKLTRWSRRIRETLEDLGPLSERRLAEAVGYRFQHLRTLKAARTEGEEALERAYDTNDFFADALLYACDWTVEEVWRGKNPLDKAVRKLARRVAMDWKWATGKKLPKVLDDDEHWGSQSTFGPHPLWIALDAADFCVGWGTVRVLTNYALKRYPSAGGGVGQWALDDNVFL